MEQKKVKFAVVGVGGLGVAHLLGIKNNSDIAECVAICDSFIDLFSSIVHFKMN